MSEAKELTPKEMIQLDQEFLDLHQIEIKVCHSIGEALQGFQAIYDLRQVDEGDRIRLELPKNDILDELACGLWNAVNELCEDYGKYRF